MTIVQSLEELDIPQKHKTFLEIFLKNVNLMHNRSKVERLILFGSCARGEATEYSDIDIAALGEDIDDDTLGELYFCAPTMRSGIYVENDILAITNRSFAEHKNSYGRVQKYIEREGLDISGLL